MHRRKRIRPISCQLDEGDPSLGVATAQVIEDPRMGEMQTAHLNYGMSFGSMLPGLSLAEPSDISDAVLYLASQLPRAVTGPSSPSTWVPRGCDPRLRGFL